MPTRRLLITDDGTDYADDFPRGKPTTPPPHYDKICEYPADDDNSYIETAQDTTQRVNRFLKETLTLPEEATITSVDIVARIRNVPNPSYPTTSTGDLGFYIAGIDYWSGVSIDPADTYADYTRRFTENPDTGAPWSVLDVNNAEACVKGKSSLKTVKKKNYFSFYRITQVYLIVNYEVPVVPARPSPFLKTPVSMIYINA